MEGLHGLNGIQFNICYTDKDGDLLPINNDNNLQRVLNVTAGILRLIIQRKGECYNNGSQFLSGSYDPAQNYTGSSSGGGGSSCHFSNMHTPSYRAANLITQIKSLKDLSTTFSHNSSAQKPFVISLPEDFRPVSAIIDVDILPETYRRIRLNKHKSSKPLGFYIRDGRSLRVTPQGVEQVPGIFISRLMPGGLAESTGLLSVNDEVIEVNGIEVAGKTLDQVTDMMVANSSNLIITVKPTNQRYNLNRSNNNSNQSQNQAMMLANNSLKKPTANTTPISNSSLQKMTGQVNKSTPSSNKSNFKADKVTPSAMRKNADLNHVTLDFVNQASDSKAKFNKQVNLDESDPLEAEEVDEDDDEEILTGHVAVTAQNGSGPAVGSSSTATSNANSPHRAPNLNSSTEDNDNSDEKILTL